MMVKTLITLVAAQMVRVDFGMYLVTDSNSWETYSPEEKDWGHPPHGTSPSTWERSETFKFTKSNPQFQVITVALGNTLVQPTVQHTGTAPVW
jgi:hypothetical protein